MAETSTTDDVSAKLTDALRDLIREVNGMPTSAAAPVAPGVWNVFFLLLLVANLSFLIYLIPANLLEGPHWELLEKAIPVVGGSLFVLVASWYKDWTLRISNTRYFRITQVAVTIIFVFSLLIPWLHIKPQIAPTDARLMLDGDLDPIDAKNGIWLTMKGHNFTISRREWNSNTKGPHQRQVRLGWREILRASFGGDQPRLALCYQVKFTSEKPGIKLRIQPQPGFAFDRQFLQREATDHFLEAGADKSLIYSLPISSADFGATQLPDGNYWVTPIKAGCNDGPTQPLKVTPADDGKSPMISIPDWKCEH